MQPEKKQRIYWIDCLKMVAIYMVILDHTAFENQYVHSYISALFIDCAVPVFFILVGYNSAGSYQRGEFQRIGQWYQKDFILNKMKRLLLPYLAVLLFEVLYKVQVEGLDAMEIWERLLYRGGWGPGSYFPIVMVQVTLLVPVLIYFAKSHWAKTFLSVVVFQTVFEFVVNTTHLDSDIYRMLAFRYTTCVMLGIVFYFLGSKPHKLWIPIFMGLLGVLYLFAITVLDYKPIIFQSWQEESGILPAFYAFAIVYFAFRMERHFKNHPKWCALPQLIGQASYHIFLVQMMFFHFKLPQQLETYWGGLPISVLSTLVICSLAGIIWSNTEDLVFKRYIRKPIR
jgi:fucose 4-O-acetylase-like acetyltransferase